jgi:phenylpyruvate tautomerase PptA (4-oxalocrotonate tautomerase family)
MPIIDITCAPRGSDQVKEELALPTVSWAESE